MGVAPPTAMDYIREVALFFEEIAPLYIRLPDAHEFPRLSTVINGEDAILFVDGFLPAIQRPDHAGDDFYCARGGKCRDSINVQIICDRFGLIREVVTGMPGRMHDKTALQHSAAFRNFVNGLPNGYIVLGDSAYQGYDAAKLRVPHHGVNFNNLTQAEREYNTAHSSLRSVVERVNLCIEVKWRILQMKEFRVAAKTGVVLASQIVLAAAVLHNRYTNFIA